MEYLRRRLVSEIRVSHRSSVTAQFGFSHISKLTSQPRRGKRASARMSERYQLAGLVILPNRSVKVSGSWLRLRWLFQSRLT